MDDQKQKVIDSLKQANNILVTVRNGPSIDQLAACIALTLIINELGKHGTAVFSGHIPSVLEFLEPDKTLERNTDSLRDFIISLDKAKADKLRYKVEDTVVKVFITPYRTSLSADDLEFSQGDFNVDVVVALGVHNQNDLDEAITAHGRILHDATVISLNTEGGAEDLGSINWVDSNYSSLSEMVYSFVDKLGKEDVVDNQVATALLTGIVAETGRFSNSRTRPETMEAAAKLLTAGANQELVAAKLAEPEQPEEPPQESYPNDDGGNNPPPPPQDGGGRNDGELEIEHSDDEQQQRPPEPQPEPPRQPEREPEPQPAPQPEQMLPRQDNGPSFAQENASYDIPQEPERPLDQEDRPSGEPDPYLQQSQQIPPIIDLNQPAQPEIYNQQEANEEKMALDYLKERQIPDSRARLQPLHSPGELLESPKIVPDRHRAVAQAPGSNNDDALNTRFAMTPPSMGGTLTANVPEEEEYDALMDDGRHKQTTGPMLSHETHPATGTERSDRDEPAHEEHREERQENHHEEHHVEPKPKYQPPEEAPRQPEPPREETPKPEEPKPEPAPAPEPQPKLEAAPTTPSAQPALDATPLSAEEQRHVEVEEVPAPKPEAVSEHHDVTEPQYTTLEELEKQVHAHNETPELAKQPVLQAAPAGAQDMPAPVGIKLPTPQTASPTASLAASPLAPPPPVPPPLPSA